MKVFYKSTITYRELEPGCVFRTIPDMASLELQKGKNESPFDVILDGIIIDSDISVLECKPETELIIRQNGYSTSYSVRPLVHPISNELMNAYEQFSYEYGDKTFNEIDAVKNGQLKMYAVDQSTDVKDWTELFDSLESSFNALKNICDKPKSHLKAVNEVRPIETVKRIGHESIPYLAAHSEDWLARTASGLKPARLFSRVEDDDYQIYENRVVKTLIDMILSFLRKKEKEFRDKYEQLHGIINSNVQVGSFGFDATFQKAVSELLVADGKGEENRTKVFQLVEKLHKRSAFLLKRYRTLRKSRLYKYLKKAKPVTNPLNETNILTMDKNYKTAFVLWKDVHKAGAPLIKQEPSILEFKFAFNDYKLYCKSICGYAAHILGFEIQEDGRYFRVSDSLSLTISDDGGLIHCSLRDETKRSMDVTVDLEIPITAGNGYGPFYFDGEKLFWDSNASDDDIEAFCSLIKHKASNGKEQAEKKKKYQSLKIAISNQQRLYEVPQTKHFAIWPAAIEIENDNRGTVKDTISREVSKYLDNSDIDYFVVALPRCDEAEQKITNYAKRADERLLFLPITMFDINSFRRIQNLLIRLIVAFETDNCPCCGNSMRKSDNRLVCDNCGQLTLTKTICPNPDCKSSYYYISYDVSEDTVNRMAKVSEDNFFMWDSLYQYKDIGPMSISDGKIRAICPCCGK